jgi:hypothetical protein
VRVSTDFDAAAELDRQGWAGVSDIGWIFLALAFGIAIAILDLSRRIDRTNRLLERLLEALNKSDHA